MKRKRLWLIAVIFGIAYVASYLGLRLTRILIHEEDYIHMHRAGEDLAASSGGLAVHSHSIKMGGSPPHSSWITEWAYAPVELVEIGFWQLAVAKGTVKECSCHTMAQRTQPENLQHPVAPYSEPAARSPQG